MSREIKFRYYYPNQVKNSNFIYSNEYKEWDDKDGGGDVHLTLVYGEWAIGHNKDNPDWSIDEEKLQQYTGLKDKNGKEIYEGDIVKYLTNSEEREEKLEKIHELKFCGFYPLNMPWLLYSTIEVIGNIFENPNLLTK